MTWPTSVSTDADLSVAVNSLQTTLSTSINNSVTSVVLASATGFPTAGYVTIDNEVISYTGISTNTLTGCTRGADGTTAAAHNSGVAVSATIVAAHHNSLRVEVEAIETYLANNLGTGSQPLSNGHRALTSNASGKIVEIATTDTELGYVSGVTSAIQTQISAKKTVATGNNYKWETTGSGGSLQETTVTPSKAVATDANGLPVASSTTDTELGYVHGVTSAIQTQLDSKIGGTNQPQNLLVNGGFDFWQRATTFSSPANNAYTADRWKLVKDGTPTFTVSRESGTVDANKYSCKLDVTSANGTYLILGNYLEAEFGMPFNGSSLTLSVRVKCSTAGKINIYIGDGASKTFSSANVGTGWETLTVTKTIGSVAADGDLVCGIGFCSGIGGAAAPAVCTTYLSGAMLVMGTAAINYVPKNLQTEQSQCYRYYQAGTYSGQEPKNMYYQNPNDYAYFETQLPVEMRANPSLVFSISDVTYANYPSAATSTASQTIGSWSNPGGATTKKFSVFSTRTHQTTYNTFFLTGTWTAESEI